MHVPFFKSYLTQQEIDNVNSVLNSGWLTTGSKAKEFESLFANYIGVKYCIAVNSATAALHLSVLVSRVQPGDYVLVPTMTFASTAEILYYYNVKPILVDCNIHDLTISIEDAEIKLLEAKKAGKHVSAIIPVHYAGKMANMDLVEDFADKYDLDIIEDAAHCCGSSYFSKKYKGWLNKNPKSLSQCYSFYCNKCITTCGEGGMVATDSEEFANKIRSLSLHGLSSNAWDRFGKKGNIFYDIACPGFKYNLTDVAAAMGIAQIEKADFLKEKRTQAVELYKKLLKDNPYIHLLDDEPKTYKHSYHLFVIRYIRPGMQFPSRDQLLQSLKGKDIVPSVHWKPLHMHSFYQKQGFKNEDFPNATQAFEEIISLPLFSGITEEQIVYVVNTLNELLNVKTRF